jgi:alanyl-tRNA synthetase
MKSSEIRNRFIEYFKSQGHTEIPSASLVPENDPTVLFNTAGMQPLVPYLMGTAHPAGKRIVNLQKCLRTNDIDEVGDNTHLTFFEMTGNWSLGDYFKKEAINWSYELLTNKEKGFGLDPQRLYITCFEGNADVPKDEESANTWKGLFEKNGVTGERVFFLGADANWWPAVKGKDDWTGPTGPCSEMFYDVTGTLNKGLTKEEYLEADEKQTLVEIGNDVFMEFKKDAGKIVGKLENKNVDDGRGFERLTMVIQGKSNVFDTDIFMPIIENIESFIDDKSKDSVRHKRIIADHMRAAVMLITDGVLPGNADQGYVLRRLIRRAVRSADALGLKKSSLFWIADTIIDQYKDVYPNVGKQKESIKVAIDKEEQKFRNTLKQGLKEFEKSSGEGKLTGHNAFILFSTYGFPIEITQEMCKEKGISLDKTEFEEEMKKHQELSKAGAEQKFKGGLGGHGEMETRYHTATHLLHQALRTVLGDHVSQKGSNITAERLRFDFTHPAKMTDDEKSRVETIVNEKIQASLPVNVVEMSLADAEKTGALHFFGDKYGEKVTVYYIGDSIDAAFSKEFCGGPHVKNTNELGKFKIAKEEAVAAGVRRIKAVLE